MPELQNVHPPYGWHVFLSTQSDGSKLHQAIEICSIQGVMEQPQGSMLRLRNGNLVKVDKNIEEVLRIIAAATPTAPFAAPA